MYYMSINKNLVHQVGDQTKVILRCTVNQPSRVIHVRCFVFSACYIVTVLDITKVTLRHLQTYSVYVLQHFRVHW